MDMFDIINKCQCFKIWIFSGEWWKSDTEAIIKEALKSGLAPNVSDAHTINGHTGSVQQCVSSQGETYYKMDKNSLAVLLGLNFYDNYKNVKYLIFFFLHKYLKMKNYWNHDHNIFTRDWIVTSTMQEGTNFKFMLETPTC